MQNLEGQLDRIAQGQVIFLKNNKLKLVQIRFKENFLRAKSTHKRVSLKQNSLMHYATSPAYIFLQNIYKTDPLMLL